MSRIKKKNRKKDKKTIGQVIKLILQVSLLLFLLAIVGGIVYFYNSYGKTLFELQAEAKKIVSASTPETFRASQTSLVYDSEGELISTLKTEKDQYYIDYKDIPSLAIHSMVVTEDKKFMEHDGVDYLANVRAAIALIKNKGKITQGASTVTQQLARNMFLTTEVTYKRKVSEIFIAQELEKKYSKTQILEYYFNNIYFANGHYGILAAANGYFGKGVAKLSLSQIAFLCAIPNNPNIYNPVTNMENTMERRDRILHQLYQEKKINLIDYRNALEEEIILYKIKKDKKDYVETFAYYSAIRALMQKDGFVFQSQFAEEEDKEYYEEAYYDLYYKIQKDLFVSGYRIYTSLDLKKQELLQESVDETLEKFTSRNKEGIYELQGAAVCIDNDNGRVVAIVGGRSQDFHGYTLNRGYQSYRQPGSSIKPLIVYAPAFERDYVPDSIVVDERLEDGPKNASRNYVGEMKLSRAIELSKNTIAWKLFEELTPQRGMSYLHKMNFAKIVARDYVPAASLGGFTIGVSPLEMASAFSALENGGIYREPTCIVKIMDSEGNEVVGDYITETRIYKENAAKLMTETLVGVIKNGTGKGLGLTNTISAGKTGTTNEKKDGWFIGYTPYYTTSVWVGYDMPKPLEGLTGASYPGSIWHNYMERIHTKKMKDTFELYDWRLVLKKEKEAEKETEEKEKRKDLEVILPEEGSLTMPQESLGPVVIDNEFSNEALKPNEQAGENSNTDQIDMELEVIPPLEEDDIEQEPGEDEGDLIWGEEPTGDIEDEVNEDDEDGT